MEWLNYHHLLYFWTVARRGSITAASTELRLASPTISGQIKQLEGFLGAALFERRGRKLVLTDVGRLTFDYAEEIFSSGRELLEALRGKSGKRTQRLVVGVVDELPKPIVKRLLEPALRVQDLRLVCREDRTLGEFVRDLAAHELDVVLSDRPADTTHGVRVFSHRLGECGTSFFATAAVAEGLRRRFPESLDGAHCLLPTPGSVLRQALDEWLQAHKVSPKVVGEFDDPALMNIFGQDGAGIFAGPSAIEADIRRRYQVRVVGRVRELRQQFYAIAAQRKLAHPAVVAIWDGRQGLFA